MNTFKSLTLCGRMGGAGTGGVRLVLVVLAEDGDPTGLLAMTTGDGRVGGVGHVAGSGSSGQYLNGSMSVLTFRK